jgi:UDP-N-acetylmuramoylalanine--D-glutamate ligase
MIDLKDKRIVVMGLGRFGGGVDAARYAAAQGGRVLVTDMAPESTLQEAVKQLETHGSVEFRLGSHEPNDFIEADVVVANPAVPPGNRFLQLARDHSAVITTQINLFFERCPARVVGITGANGKSTTAALTAHLLETIGPQVWLGGNIGNRPLLSNLNRIRTDDLVVLELSSFQTEMLASIETGPRIALLTNLTPNHLDRHGSFEQYCQAKEALFQHQPTDTDNPPVSLFCAEDPVGVQWYQKYRSQPGRICRLYSIDQVSDRIRGHYCLPGHANLLNLAAALAIARCFSTEDEALAQALSSFQPLQHRLQCVATKQEIRWINDSIATTPESTMVALDAFAEPTILIAGGYDKGISFDELARAISKKAKAVILIGQTAPKLSLAIEASSPNHPPIITSDSLEGAVHQAATLAQQGDVVILSPACASYDMFDNFQQRGNKFIRLVQALPD